MTERRSSPHVASNSANCSRCGDIPQNLRIFAQDLCRQFPRPARGRERRGVVEGRYYRPFMLPALHLDSAFPIRSHRRMELLFKAVRIELGRDDPGP